MIEKLKYSLEEAKIGVSILTYQEYQSTKITYFEVEVEALPFDEGKLFHHNLLCHQIVSQQELILSELVEAASQPPARNFFSMLSLMIIKIITTLRRKIPFFKAMGHMVNILPCPSQFYISGLSNKVFYDSLTKGILEFSKDKYRQ